jgi:hypothetical protein
MHYVIGVLIIAFSDKFFTLLPAYHVKGVFNIADLGNLLLWVMLGLVMLRSKRIAELFNPISFFVVGYLFMVILHVTNASISYDQGVFSGLIRSRHQFFYLSYFYFLLVFNTTEKLERFLNILTWIAIGLIFLSVANYYWPVIFHHELWAEGHGDRSGIKRAFIPGMNIIGLTFLWQITKTLHGSTQRGRAAARALLLFGGLLFRQTRGRIISATLIASWMLFQAHRLKLLLAAVLTVGVAVVLLQLFLPENLLVKSYTSAYSDFVNQEGTWLARMEQIETDWEAFVESPWIGSSAILIRQSDGMQMTQDVIGLSYQADLGWTHWLKNYGLMGMIWSLGLMSVIYLGWRRSGRGAELPLIATLAWYQWLHLLVGMVTLGYFFRADGITVVSLTLAMLTRTLFIAPQEPRTKIGTTTPELLNSRILRKVDG